jgi:hypothetical protein
LGVLDYFHYTGFWGFASVFMDYFVTHIIGSLATGKVEIIIKCIYFLSKLSKINILELNLDA